MSMQSQVQDLTEQKHGVPAQFNRVASTYDLLTGLNPGYKKHLLWSAKRLCLEPNARILDLCCGTGLSTAALVESYPEATIDGVDASQEMIACAKAKSWPSNVRFQLGNAMDLSACDLAEQYDGILMAYGIRNVPDMDQGLQQVLNRLAPGGRVCFHEYSVADSKRSQWTWRLVSSGIIIPSGLLSGKGTGIYKYLRDSVLDFDGIKAFEQRLLDAGFVNVRTQPMDGWQRGIVHTFIAEKAA